MGLKARSTRGRDPWALSGVLSTPASSLLQRNWRPRRKVGDALPSHTVTVVVKTTQHSLPSESIILWCMRGTHRRGVDKANGNSRQDADPLDPKQAAQNPSRSCYGSHRAVGASETVPAGVSILPRRRVRQRNGMGRSHTCLLAPTSSTSPSEPRRACRATVASARADRRRMNVRHGRFMFEIVETQSAGGQTDSLSRPSCLISGNIMGDRRGPDSISFSTALQPFRLPWLLGNGHLQTSNGSEFQ